MEDRKKGPRPNGLVRYDVVNFTTNNNADSGKVEHSWLAVSNDEGAMAYTTTASFFRD